MVRKPNTPTFQSLRSMGQKINITSQDGFQLGAYLAQPQDKAKGGVVVCQEIFGVNDYLKSVCDFYAAAGYLTVAPQFFDRVERDVALDYSPQNLERALEFIPRVDLNVALDDLEAARRYIRAAARQRSARAGSVGAERSHGCSHAGGRLIAPSPTMVARSTNFPMSTRVIR